MEEQSTIFFENIAHIQWKLIYTCQWVCVSSWDTLCHEMPFRQNSSIGKYIETFSTYCCSCVSCIWRKEKFSEYVHDSRLYSFSKKWYIIFLLHMSSFQHYILKKYVPCNNLQQINVICICMEILSIIEANEESYDEVLTNYKHAKDVRNRI